MGFIPEKLRKDLAKKIDEVIDFNKIIGGAVGSAIELIDGRAFSLIIISIDENYGKGIPEFYQGAILSVLNAFVYDQFNELTDEVIDIIDELIDLPFANQELESKFVTVNLKVLTELAIYLAKK